MITKDRIEKFSKLEAEEHENRADLVRIDAFLARGKDNRDTAAAVDKGLILVKFAGTACRLPLALFEAELRKRKVEIEARLDVLKKEKEAV